MKQKEKKYLIWGIIGGILTMIGDCLLLGVDSTGAGSGALDKFAIIATRVSYARIGLGAFFGFIGIPLSVLGFYALFLSLRDKETRTARLYKLSLYGFGTLGGAIHVICCYLLTGIKKDLECGTDDLLKTVLEEQGGYVIPSVIVFFAFYLLCVITMILLIVRRKTYLPSWMWILNPLTLKILINMIGNLGTSAFLNGLGCSNMSLGGIIIFITWFCFMQKEGEKNDSI
ncbi:MAG: hypothetical protein IKO03_04430 [Lachnospiraceae bacterium]|nr:hypothetical protein [Lachnospiraceae bacterium]MBR4608624.1 hypothetical protein [Lachnospiraceae bacterium]